LKSSPWNDYAIPEYSLTTGKHENKALEEPSEYAQLVSKSQLKRDAQAMKDLTSELLDLSKSQLSKVPLEEDILLAIQQARTMRSHGARRRQLLYIAKLIRRSDPAPIIDAVGGFHSEARALTGRQHRSEAWRDLLLEQGDTALGELLQQRDGVDAQSLRQLIRNATHELKEGKPPAAARALFRALRDMDLEQPLPPCP
jgi:ribosome-associated protein